MSNSPPLALVLHMAPPDAYIGVGLTREAARSDHDRQAEAWFDDKDDTEMLRDFGHTDRAAEIKDWKGRLSVGEIYVELRTDNVIDAIRVLEALSPGDPTASPGERARAFRDALPDVEPDAVAAHIAGVRSPRYSGPLDDDAGDHAST